MSIRAEPGEGRTVLALLELVASQRQPWRDEARCRDLGMRFTTLDHEGQKVWCRGCPVRRECLDDLIDRVEEFGMRELTDGNLVCGGLTPAEQRSELLRRRQERTT